MLADMAQWFSAPMAYPFMVRGLTAALIVGIVCAVLGTYVVLRGMAFLGDALAHAILPGVAVGYLVAGGMRASLFWWALGTGVLTSVGIGAISLHGRIKEDTAIGVTFAGMFALGIALISSARSYSVDLAHILFGNVLGVSSRDLTLIAAFGALVLLLVVAFYKELLVVAFDPTLAATLRVPMRFIHYLLMVMLAIAVVISLQTVGVALLVALLVTPAAAAFLLTRRLLPMMLVAAAIGALSSVVGLYISYYVQIASGSAIVLVCTGMFVLAFLLAPGRGIIWQRLHQPVD
jgi:manganese/iron transport system permease protein